MKDLKEQFPSLGEQESFETEEVDTAQFSRGKKVVK